MKNNEESLLNQLESHIKFIQKKIKESVKEVRVWANADLREIYKMSPEERMANLSLRESARNRLTELIILEGSPYFMKCEVVDENGKSGEYFFAKHQFIEQSIYSWVSPIATIRFENLGQASYRVPSGETKKITIKQREQYMIVNGKVIYFAVEKEGEPRKLIYQEYFTKQKEEFALPEIVAQMEKAQDQVIRTGHYGPMVISGPAGSGKTTLALHRVAYLNQFSDTARLYAPSSIIIFVQDSGTKDYFSKLLPSLGIKNIHIATFSDWAFEILAINGYSFIERYGESEGEKDLYEYQKFKALKEGHVNLWDKNIFKTLLSRYEKHFSSDILKLFKKQKKEKKLDRFDLIVLLESYLKKYGKFETRRKYQTFIKDRLVNKTEKTSALYSLMIIDEFQNYLPEQLSILKGCLKNSTQSVVYVGDIAQQTKLGAIKNWEEIGETIPAERNIILGKIYRNTKNILSFIQSLGYQVIVPDGAKEGPVVVEKTINTSAEAIDHIRKNIPRYKNGTIGILAENELYLKVFKKAFSLAKNVHILTILESQGVEFDIVFVVGMGDLSSMVGDEAEILSDCVKERRKLQKNLLYLALTRAITELHILGKKRLKDI